MKKQKSKYRFNIVDVLLIVVILAVLAAVYYFVAGRNTKGSESENTIRYTVEMKTVDRDYIDCIAVGDKVTETIRSRPIGKVVDVAVEPAWTLSQNLDTGEIKKTYYPPINDPAEGEEPIYELYNVKITVEADADYTGSSYTVGGFDVAVGALIYFRLPHFVSSGYCIALDIFE